MKRCYMILFESGLVKVGYANPLYYRIKEHKRQAEIHGNKVKFIWFSSPIFDYKNCESQMIIECSSSFERIMNEYFTGCTEESCEFILDNISKKFTKCLDIVPSKEMDKFSAIFSDDVNRKKSNDTNEGFECSKAMVKVLDLISKNKILSKGLIRNRMRGYSKYDVYKAIEFLIAAKRIKMHESVHGQNQSKTSFFTLYDYKITSDH